MILNILVFLLSLSLVIILHELGHFIMARKAGILCHEFSLGMGPTIWKTKKGETTYTIKAIPIGGYVMMAGEEISDEVVKKDMKVRLVFDGKKVDKIILDHENPKYEQYEKVKVERVDLLGKDNAPLYLNEYEVKRNAFYVFKNRELQIAPYERGFDGKTVWQRFKAIFAGPFMNFILAFVVFVIVNLIVGFPNMESTEVGFVGDNLPASTLLEVGDEITEINGVTVTNWDELSLELDKAKGDRSINIVAERDGVEGAVDGAVTPILYFYNIGFHSAEDAGETLEIGDLSEGTVADKAGFKEGDVLVSVDYTYYPVDANGNELPAEVVSDDYTTWEDVITSMESLGEVPYKDGFSVVFTVERNNETIELTAVEPFTAAFLETQNIELVTMRIGISPEYTGSFVDSITGGFKDLWSSAGIIFTTIGLLFDNTGAGAGVGVDNLAGPLGIYQITSQALANGFVSLLSWIGLLSVNLGVINLLPIPALDGGRLVFLGYEAVTRRKPNKRIENTLHYVMYLLLMGLFVFITYHDLLRLIGLE